MENYECTYGDLSKYNIIFLIKNQLEILNDSPKMLLGTTFGLQAIV